MKYLLSIVCYSICFGCFAQQNQFLKDDNGKFIYYKVVDSQTVNKTTLQKRALSFVTDLYQKQMKPIGQTDSSVTAKGKLIIDKTVLVVGHPSGELTYNFSFQTRDGKYRYWLSDFEFIPYQRDRYGNFVPSTSIGTPLEKSKDKLSAREWNDIHESAYKKVIAFAETFEKFLKTAIVEKSATKTPETISTKKW